MASSSPTGRTNPALQPQAASHAFGAAVAAMVLRIAEVRRI
jgi:hypothetical protein